MSIRNILILTTHDLAVAYKNKTVFLILFIPFFVFFSLKLVDPVGVDFKKTPIALIQNQTAASPILQTIQSANNMFNISFASSEEEGERWLKEKKIDGLLVRSKKEQNRFILVVLKKESLQALSIVERLAALQKAAEGNNPGWISDIRPLQVGGIQKQILPTWILMLVLLIGFIILPAQVAEEKEKQLLFALLQTPMREIEWLIAKLFLGMFLILTAVLFLHLLGKFDFGNTLSYAAFMAAGAFCFSSYGILLGFLCRTPATARTLGVVFYLPNLLPSALSDFSERLSAVAPFFPSYRFYNPIKSILLEQGSLSNHVQNWTFLFITGLLAILLTHRLLRKRWLM
ncbi:MAG: ABC transporter permease [Fibrobacteres bacterium]|nr:ABC transporter permease [Fibrobacterota bacterium]